MASVRLVKSSRLSKFFIYSTLGPHTQERDVKFSQWVSKQFLQKQNKNNKWKFTVYKLILYPKLLLHLRTKKYLHFIKATNDQVYNSRHRQAIRAEGLQMLPFARITCPCYYYYLALQASNACRGLVAVAVCTHYMPMLVSVALLYT